MLRRYFKRPVHFSWLITATCIGIIIGIIAVQYSPSGAFTSLSYLLTGLALVLTSFLRARAWGVLLAIFGGLLIGLWRGDVVQVDSSMYARFINQKVVLVGKVREDTDINKRGQLVIRLSNIKLSGVETSGSIWLTTDNNSNIQRSDIVTVAGVLKEGFGSFSASMYSGKITRLERPKPGDIALDVRNTFADGTRKAISEPQASLGLGYLVGQRRGLPEELDNALQAAGLTHIVVASGYNLTILVRLARRLFENVSKYLSLLSASGMILSFIAITGLSPSMSRAGLVAGLSLLAWYYGRKFHPLVLLPFAMAITLLIQPSYGWGDLGWQLSFAAFGGVMILAPLTQAYFFGDKPEKPLRRILIETLSAQIATLPILLLAFGQFSVIAPVANILILPLVPLAMVLTFIAGLGGLFLPTIAEIVGIPAEMLLTYMTETAMLSGSLPWATHEVEISILSSIAMYLLIIGGSTYMWRKTKYNLRDSNLVE